MANRFDILVDDHKIFRGIAVLATPEEGLRQQGFIRVLGGGGQQAKHVVYMMAQRALLDFEESALEIQWLKPSSVMVIPLEPAPLSLTRGAVLAMNEGNEIRFFIHEGLEIRPFLVALHRLATRMIRLDVP